MQYVFFQRAVSQQFRDLGLRMWPVLREPSALTSALLKILYYVLFAPYRRDETGEPVLILPRSTFATIIGYSENPRKLVVAYWIAEFESRLFALHATGSR